MTIIAIMVVFFLSMRTCRGTEHRICYGLPQAKSQKHNAHITVPLKKIEDGLYGDLI